ncbi:MAG: flagellar basal-body MS-ring/collar protein FliF [Desulfuromonadia bacterium]
MPEVLKKLLEPILALEPGKRWLVGGVTAAAVALFIVLIVVANQTEYKPLFANLSTEDAAEITMKLKEQKVPYKVAADGRAILVPSDKVYDLRLSLASAGLPQGGGVGYEIFDRKSLGMTEFVQKLNYQRALQGELARTISQLAGVEHARVHLAIPEKSLFKENEKPPTASIFLKLKGGGLRESEVQGIVHLVASSVEGLDPSHITILDSKGKVLSRGDGDPQSKMGGTMHEVQRNFERASEERLQSLLDKVVGPGRSVARVAAEFNYRQVEKMEERYDPEATAVRSEQRSEERGASTNGAVGVPGVQTNLGRTAPGGAPPQTIGGSKNDETLNYEISRSTSRIIEPVGNLSRISVAILVDGKYEEGTGGKEGAKPKYVPRTPDELQKIEALVKSAVGFNGERGDQVTVANIPFQETPDNMGSNKGGILESPFFLALFKNLLIGIGFIALIFLVIRPMIKALRAAVPPRFEPIETAEEEVRKMLMMKQSELAQQGASQRALIEKVRNEAYETAQVLKSWLDGKGPE